MLRVGYIAIIAIFALFAILDTYISAINAINANSAIHTHRGYLHQIAGLRAGFIYKWQGLWPVIPPLWPPAWQFAKKIVRLGAFYSPCKSKHALDMQSIKNIRQVIDNKSISQDAKNLLTGFLPSWKIPEKPKLL